MQGLRPLANRPLSPAAGYCFPGETDYAKILFRTIATTAAEMQF